ncbi:metallophosphoesterase [Pyxidicoccus xibeiensis]|uniref:metallophosphoesterase n=1 Tax=Pyxidicoccus xibeiensis TaxID=2906759 RepID=UPI0020A8207C|nr:metallophosphoesterase [Pyxidicoccus xibeiensis]MCP3142077.1 metallophosphoesterase [Pyxidicoccus xibeiensis]
MRTPNFIVSLALAGGLSACGGNPQAEPSELGTDEAALDCAAMASSPIYHRIKPANGDSLYTYNANEAANAATTYGYTEDRGIAFRASRATGTGLSPVYRLYSPSRNEHFWTIDAAERQDLLTNGGFTTDEGIGFYASKTADPCLVPVYRYSNTTLRKHRFAITAAERSALSSAGWVDEGIKLYAAPTAPVPVDTKFTLVIIPDTQNELVSASTLIDHRMQWLADNKSALDIRFVGHTGDMCNWDTPDHIQYVRASNAFQKLDAAQIPYAIAVGNHDTAATCPGGSACPGNVNANLRNTTTFNTYFPTTRFQALAGVYEAGKSDNGYHTFTAGGLNWLVLNLELWARTDVVGWVKTVLAAHPRHNVIVITHSHQTSSGGIEQSNGGYGNNSPQYVFDNALKLYPNVRFIFSGHVGTSAYREVTGTQGNKIYQMLTTYHDSSTNPTRLIEIDTAANTFSTRVYMPYTNTEKTDGSKFTISNVSWVR